MKKELSKGTLHFHQGAFDYNTELYGNFYGSVDEAGVIRWSHKTPEAAQAAEVEAWVTYAWHEAVLSHMKRLQDIIATAQRLADELENCDCIGAEHVSDALYAAIAASATCYSDNLKTVRRHAAQARRATEIASTTTPKGTTEDNT